MKGVGPRLALSVGSASGIVAESLRGAKHSFLDMVN